MIESFDNWDSVTSYIKLSNITLVITRKENLSWQSLLLRVLQAQVSVLGTALGLLNNGGNGGGVLGGLFGNNNQATISALQAENSQLRAENYSDKNAKEVYMQSLTDNRRLRDETFAYLKPLADESANNRVELAKLQAELKCCCEKHNKEPYHTEGDIRAYKDALKALYYLISIEKSK